MKKLFPLILLFTLFVTLLQAQERKDQKLSNIDLFSAKSGTLIEKQYIDIGNIKLLAVRVIKLKDLNDGSTSAALRLEYNDKIASLDSDELDGLIKSIKNLQENVFTSKKEIYTEVIFKSRSGFEAGAYYDVKKEKWSAYLQLDKYSTNSSLFLNVEDFVAFLSLVEQAKAKL